ncbi:MAG: pyridoxine 5'-phosphate synthase [Cyclobacteriaceae bacterium]|nr:pyridoxine 5'-phosphate synthase [Cyclobacteriaceae bacterium]MCK5280463.1 pyridoxine 5'-phosphate synthase [Cyclobacteriaceae bacterium]
MTKLSVNINKIATLRNARGGDMPNVVKMAIDCEKFGAEGITVHPRPDERHIKYNDVLELKAVVTTEFNIEGYPDERYMDLVNKVKPHQATLVPDPPDAITSNAGWDTIENKELLKKIIEQLKSEGIRTSIFVEPKIEIIEAAKEIGTDRIELYTEPYAANYKSNREGAIRDFVVAANKAKELGIGINAGHDLSLENLHYLKEHIPFLDEVSIGHALISDALYYGIQNTIQMYKRKLILN